MTASEMFGVPIKDMPSEVRRRAKAINFGIIYGISAFGLANQLGISREEAGAYIQTYFERFPGIRDYMEATKKRVHETGLRGDHLRPAHSLSGGQHQEPVRAGVPRAGRHQCADPGQRRRHHPPRHGAHAGRDRATRGLSTARMLLQVHDELVFEVAARMRPTGSSASRKRRDGEGRGAGGEAVGAHSRGRQGGGQLGSRAH